MRHLQVWVLWTLARDQQAEAAGMIHLPLDNVNTVCYNEYTEVSGPPRLLGDGQAGVSDTKRRCPPRLTQSDRPPLRFSLACCGIRVRADQSDLAEWHWGHCIADQHAFRPNPKRLRQNLDPDKCYSLDTTVFRPRRYLTSGDPQVRIPLVDHPRGLKFAVRPWAVAIKLAGFRHAEN